ncbi:DUF397 domain-containing protein [Nocardiopsis alba]|uniref:DUF397 domain-containing protein n=1 Tax=Nocardiopsis alba TaxID=53437 RepID=UPI0033B1C35F
MLQATQSLTTATWHKASYSSTGDDCVEVCEGRVTGIRDTKHRTDVELAVPAHEWAALLRAL